MMLEKKVLVLFFLAGVWDVPGATDLVVPNELANKEGNSFDLYPFLINQTSIHSMRYQQVSAASQFSVVNPLGSYLTYLFFRADGASQGAVAGVRRHVHGRRL